MLKLGPVEKKLREEIRKRGTICLGLIDSENLKPEIISNVVKKAADCGISGILVGGSTSVDQIEQDIIIKNIKDSVTLPVILFPSNITGISRRADAILFSSLLTSDNPYFISEVQALGAILVRKYSLEALPMAYLIVGDGGAAGFIGHARGIPPSKPEIAAMYALSARYLGMRFVYLEGGSGVTSHVPLKIVKAVRNIFDGVIIAGGGIRKAHDAEALARAGADILVIGTLLEKEDFEDQLKQIVKKARG